MTRRLAVTAGVVLLALGFVTFTPVGEAALTLEAVGPTDRIIPDGKAMNATITARMPCSEALQYGGPANPRANVVVNWAGPADVMLAGPNSIVIDSTICATNPNGDATQSERYTVSATRSAPGMVPLTIQLNGTLPSHVSAAILPEQKTTTTMPIEVGYYGRIRVDVANKFVSWAGDGTATAYMTIENQGNAPTQVTFTPLPGQGLEVSSGPVLVPVGGFTNASVQIKTTNAPPPSLSIELSWETRAEGTEAIGDGGSLRLLARTDYACDAKSCIRSSPAPFVGLLVVLALTASRRRV